MTEVKKDPVDDLPTIEVVYIGRRYNEKDKTFSQLFVRYEDISELNFEDVNYRVIDQKALWFSSKSKFQAYIGCRYTLPYVKEPDTDVIKTFYLGRLKFVEGVSNFVHKSVWIELDKIITHVKNSESMQKKIRANNGAEQAIDRLKWVYNQLPPSHRKAFLISLMMEIQK
ncbi:hypothetical protein PP940_gp209 [Rhizobium phage RL2RES]|uniref:Uncharacterized protein n=1 Tax=Rhizobium phage RL2RES TaxID=103371 RepID=A0A6B9JDB8_9CAUD|nr:hypothetical protein PP940_gp209 [Rhizobium phage RL2RES]QGZ14186.1 hypothetical protein RL2RES_209 [Rhizobium phage RL2RES]